jgi:hypothetical protein
MAIQNIYDILNCTINTIAKVIKFLEFYNSQSIFLIIIKTSFHYYWKVNAGIENQKFSIHASIIILIKNVFFNFIII